MNLMTDVYGNGVMGFLTFVAISWLLLSDEVNRRKRK